jgi:putative nucleotidyltransferase with HDIG domain
MLMPEPTTSAATILWWVVFLAAILFPLLITSHLVRRMLPLAALLELTLVFPDEAPSRFAVAKASGRTRDLKKHLSDDTGDREANEAAAAVLSLITSLGDHDRRTRGHSERVRAFTDMLAEQVGIPADDREKLRWGALLHDIGKLEVDPKVLNKNGAPDPDEWEILHRHPIEGERLLGPLRDWLGVWAGAVAHHHEHWDGTGYAQGLKGEEISLGGRILAIADSYEVMTAARPYKKPLPAETARTELARCAGTHFDPRLVREFLEISVGRLWWTIGAAAFIAQLPILGGLSYRGITERFGRSIASIAGAALVIAGLVSSGQLDTAHLRPSSATTSTEDASEDAAIGQEIDEQESAPPSEDKGNDGSGSPRSNDPTGSDGTDPIGATSPVALPPDPAGPAEDGSPGSGGDPDGADHEPRGPGEPQVLQGQITAPGVLDPVTPGLTEMDFVAACGVPNSQGLDAWVFVPKLATGHSHDAHLSGANSLGSATVKGRAYDDACQPLANYSGSSWSLPSSTHFLVVFAPGGVDTKVTLRI